MRGRDSSQLRYGAMEVIVFVFAITMMSIAMTKVVISRNQIHELVSQHDETAVIARTAMNHLWEKLLFLQPEQFQVLKKTEVEFKNLQGGEVVLRSKTKFGNPGIYDGDQLLVDHISSFGFDFLRAIGGAPSTEKEIRRIKIDFTVGAYANAGIIHLKTEVFPRGFMYRDFQ